MDWEKLPPGYSWTDVAAVAVDSKDRVYVFNRGDHPMIVFDSQGKSLDSWGEGVLHQAPRPDPWARQHALLHRRPGPRGAPVHAGRQGADDHRRAWGAS